MYDFNDKRATNVNKMYVPHNSGFSTTYQFCFQTKMKFLSLSIATASLLLASSVVCEPLKAFEHQLVDVCGVRDLLEANCNGEIQGGC